ncbi:MAG: hypothetical protein JWN25_38 [Verrucomicrobiales bacterium]|nr:hypothetical protein [Verrucomicrobiales bacterium]
MQQNARTFYQGEAGEAYHEIKRAIPSVALPWIAQTRGEKIEPFISPDQSIMEYGIGYGWNLARLQNREKTGYDVTEKLREAVEALGIRFVTSTTAIPEKSYDVVLCHHMLEHAIDPAAELGEMHRLLKDGGKLLLFVPYEKEGRYRVFNREEPNHHLFSWNPQTLGNLVEVCGFELRQAEVKQFGYERFAAKKAIQLNLGQAGYRWIHRVAHLFKPAKEVFLAATKKAPAKSAQPSNADEKRK